MLILLGKRKEKLARDKYSIKLITNIIKLRTKKLYNVGPRLTQEFEKEKEVRTVFCVSFASSKYVFGLGLNLRRLEFQNPLLCANH
jgi:hypothetical protein